VAASLLGKQLLARFPDGLHVFRYQSESEGGGAGRIIVCQLTSLENHGYSATLNYLRDPAPPDCSYDSGRTAWVYGTCPLGVSISELLPPIGDPTQ
jgi:hypothetical protein